MKAFLIVIFVFVLSYVAGEWLRQSKDDDVIQITSKSSCDVAQNICEINDKGYKYLIRFEGEPSALSPFKVILENTKPQVDSVEIEFDMDDMDMGFNVYQMKQSGTEWKARVVLPVCSLSRNDWNLKVKLKNQDKVYITEFKFAQQAN